MCCLDDKSRLNYTRWFFSPHENIKFWSGGAASRDPTYIFQQKDRRDNTSFVPPQICLSLSHYVTLFRSHLVDKLPAIYNRLEGVPVDFFNKDDDILDPYSSLHTEEEKLVSENPSEVSKEAMWLNIRSVFSLSKTGKTNEKVSNRDPDCIVTKNAMILRNNAFTFFNCQNNQIFVKINFNYNDDLSDSTLENVHKALCYVDIYCLILTVLITL